MDIPEALKKNITIRLNITTMMGARAMTQGEAAMIAMAPNTESIGSIISHTMTGAGTQGAGLGEGRIPERTTIEIADTVVVKIFLIDIRKICDSIIWQVKGVVVEELTHCELTDGFRTMRKNFEGNSTRRETKGTDGVEEKMREDQSNTKVAAFLVTWPDLLLFVDERGVETLLMESWKKSGT
jgi:hypothetical protein